MKKSATVMVISLMVLGIVRLLTVDAASAPAPVQPIEFTHQPASSANLHTPRATETLTPTLFLPLVLYNFSGPDEPPQEPPTVQFNSGSYSVYEQASTATIVVTLSAAPDQIVTVDYATSDGTAEAGSDYVAASGRLNFAPGQMIQTFTVTVNNDTLDEPDETVDLVLSNPVNAVLGTPYTATLTIADNDVPLSVQFNSSSYSAHEGAGTATAIATLNAVSDVTVTVDYAASDGTAKAGDDYAAVSGMLTFAPGETSQEFSLEIFDDPFDEPDETLTLALSNPVSATLGAPNSALLTILDEDVPSRFGLQIAALHEVTPDTISPGDHGFARPRTEAEWLALYESAYITLTTALRDSGAGWARVRVSWDLIEPEAPQPGQPPEYEWGPYHDVKLQLVAQAGVRLIATVSEAPDWAHDHPCAPIYPDRLDEFARFLTDLVNRYKGPPYFIKHWEVFNEPDYNGAEGYGVGYACYGNDGDKYAQMLAVAYPAIKAADPEATVLMGGLAYDRFTEYGGPFLRYFPDEVMEHGGGAYIDALTIHYFPDFHAEWERWVPHGNPPTCGNVEDGVGTPYEAWGIDLIAKTNHIHNRMATCWGVDKPVWITEVAKHGFPGSSSSLAQQARYVIQGNVRGLAAGAEHIDWYALTTPNDSWEFQVLYDDWSPKPAFRAYQTLTAELSGYEYTRTLDVASGEAYAFAAPGQAEKTVAWGSGTLAFAAGQVRVVDREGNETTAVDGGAGDADGTQNGAVELQLSADPVFVTVSG